MANADSRGGTVSEPQAFVVPGYGGIAMPTRCRNAELEAVVEYLLGSGPAD